MASTDLEPQGTAARPMVDAVVVSYNSAGTLRACVEPLVAMPIVTVTVVDNASPDDSPAAIADLDGVRIVRSPRNGGFAHGCNLGAKEGRAPFVLLLNPDARLDPEPLDALVATMQRDPGAGVAGPRIVDDEEGLAYSQRRFPRLRSTYAQALFAHRFWPRAAWADELVRDPAAYERPGSPDWLSGACMLVRREALEALGGLDDGFFLYCEDTDLCRRLRDAGWDVRFVPEATVRHRGGASAPRAQTERILARSRVRYARKHHGAAVARLEALGVALGGATHALAWMRRPALARGHAAAVRAALRPGAAR